MASALQIAAAGMNISVKETERTSHAMNPDWGYTASLNKPPMIISTPRNFCAAKRRSANCTMNGEQRAPTEAAMPTIAPIWPSVKPSPPSVGGSAVRNRPAMGNHKP